MGSGHTEISCICKLIQTHILASLPGLPTIQSIQCLFGQSWIVGRAGNEATLFAFMMGVVKPAGTWRSIPMVWIVHNLAN